MAQYPRVREQHIAVFGESGSGKTVLLSSFFGPTQAGGYSNDLYDLVADDPGQGTKLYRNYVGMRDMATVPPPNRFASITYFFSVKLKGSPLQNAHRSPFDILRLAWHDYPGEWFEEAPSGDEEAARRIETFRALLRSDVAVLLVDAQKLLDYKGEEARYLTSLFTNFRQGLLRLDPGLRAGSDRLIEFPRIWVLALSKADLLPDWDVDAFRDMVVLHATDEIESLRGTIRGLVDTPDALSLGEDFMLLSSAKFKLPVGDQAPVEIDVTERVGVSLLLPIASLLPLERRVQWSERMTIPRKVLESLADGAEELAAALTASRFVQIERALARVPRLRDGARLALPVLKTAVQIAGPQLRDLNKRARAQHDYLRATLTQFKLELEQGREDRILRSPR